MKYAIIILLIFTSYSCKRESKYVCVKSHMERKHKGKGAGYWVEIYDVKILKSYIPEYEKSKKP